MLIRPAVTTLFVGRGVSTAGLVSPALAADVTIDDLMDDQATTDDVVTYGLGPRGQRFSPLDAKTVNVIWRDRIADYREGYSYTAAPLIVPSTAHEPLVVTGLSGGEFGVVGAVEARNPDTGETVWRRPVIEGRIG